jgi:hypothetical protein
MPRQLSLTLCEDERALCWLAGLLEGEGYFGIIKNWVAERCYRYPRLGVTMTDPDVIERVAKVLDANVYNLKPQGTGAKLPQYRISISGSRAVLWMKQLYPLMGRRRRAQIEACLTEWDRRPSANVMRSHRMKKVARKRTRNSKGQFDSAAPAVMADFARG